MDKNTVLAVDRELRRTRWLKRLEDSAVKIRVSGGVKRFVVVESMWRETVKDRNNDLNVLTNFKWCCREAESMRHSNSNPIEYAMVKVVGEYCAIFTPKNLADRVMIDEISDNDWLMVIPDLINKEVLALDEGEEVNNEQLPA